MLYSGDELRSKLSRELRECKLTLDLVSAFLSGSVDWVNNETPDSIKKRLVVRGRKLDFVSGASDIGEVIKALEFAWDVYFLPSLHAKIYQFDSSRALIGSANLTESGLKLFGSGNLEAMAAVALTRDDREMIDNIFRFANKINLGLVKAMAEELLNPKRKESDEWETIDFDELEGLWIADFPWVSPHQDEAYEDHIEHDKKEFHNPRITPLVLHNNFSASRLSKWLGLQLERNGGEMYFGALTVAVHDAVLDDPEPYRVEIKTLLANTLRIIGSDPVSPFRIDRPNFSERISIRERAP